MLKINPEKDIKELEKFRIYPVYECNERTGKTKIKELRTNKFKIFKNLIFKEKQKIFANRIPVNKYELAVSKDICSEVDLDLLYDLIKADMVVKE